MKKIFSVITIITFSILLLGCCETETKEEREARERKEKWEKFKKDSVEYLKGVGETAVKEGVKFIGEKVDEAVEQKKFELWLEKQ